MTIAALADDEFARKRARNAEKARAWRKAHPGGDKTWRERQQRQRTQRRHSVGFTKRVNTGDDDIGPAIAEGKWATDDFAKVELKWSKLMVGARFSDVEAPRF